MSKHSSNQIFKEQNKKEVRATFKKAFINAIHISANTVDVYFAENPQTIIKNIPISSGVDITQIIKGSRCRVDLFDETNPQDMVLAFTY